MILLHERGRQIGGTRKASTANQKQSVRSPYFANPRKTHHRINVFESQIFIPLQKNHNKEEESKGLSSLELLAAGIGAATVGCLITQPVDVIKTRMMTQAASNLTPYTSVLDCVGSIFRDEGVSTFYAGMKQRYFYMAPLWAIQFALNNNIQDRFRKYNAQQKLE